MKTSRILTFIFTLLLVCVMIPVMAQSAAAADYDLWVGGEQVTDEKRSGDGWEYAPGSGTLTLSGAITDRYEFKGDSGADYTANIYSIGALTVTGNGTLSGADYGIYIQSGTSSGLTISDAYFTVASAEACFRDKNTITIADSTIGAESENSSAFYLDYGKITISGDSNVTAKGTTAGFEIGANGNVVIESGEVKASGGSYGIHKSNVQLTTKGASLTASGTEQAITGGVIIDYTERSVTVNASAPSDSGATEWTKSNADAYELGQGGTFKYVRIVPTYTVTVTNGTGGGTYEAGEDVTITANDAPTGKIFAGWTGADTLTFKDGDKDTSPATFTMPAENVSVTATYKDFTEYPLWVGDTQVTSENKDDIPVQGGSASYDPSTSTLAFENVTGVNGMYIEDVYSGVTYGILVYAKNIDLTVTGNAVLKNTEAYGGIKVSGGDLTIESKADLDIAIGIDESIYSDPALFARNIAIKGGKVSVEVLKVYGSSQTIYASADNGIVTIEEGSTVRVNNGGISSHDSIYINGGNIDLTGVYGRFFSLSETVISGGTITAEEFDSYATYNQTTINGGTITVNKQLRSSGAITIDGGVINAGDGSDKYGIYARSTLTITGGNITAKGSEYGLYGSKVDISGEETVVTAEGDTSAINSGYGITITSPLTILTPNDGKLSSDKKNICESDGETIAKKAVIAKGEYYPLWVNGVRVNSENTNDIPCDSGTAKFDWASKTLTFTDAVLSKGAWYDDRKAPIIFASYDVLNITGKVTIDTDDGCLGGIRTYYGVAISGKDTVVNITKTNKDSAWLEAIWDYRKGIYINDATINISSTVGSLRGLSCSEGYEGEIVISDAIVNISGEYGQTGISGKDITISGGEVNVLMSRKDIDIAAQGIVARGKLDISGNARVSARGGQFGIACGDLNISGIDTVVTSEGGNTKKSGRGTLYVFEDSEGVIDIFAPLDIVRPVNGIIGEDSKRIYGADEETLAGYVMIAKPIPVSVRADCAGTNLKGAELLLREDGRPIYEWTSTSISHHMDLSAGNYSISVTTPPDGYYATAMEETVVIGSDGSVTYSGSKDGNTLLVEFARTEVGILTVDGKGNPVEGAEIQMLLDGSVVDSWTSTTEAHVILGASVGKTYTLHEAKAPTGCNTAADKTFWIYADGTVKYDGNTDSSGNLLVEHETSTYTVTWDIDGKTETETYKYGETPSHADPTKAASAGKTYEFKEWTPAIVPVTADATYTATFTEKTIGILITDPETGEPVVGGTVTITDPETGEIIDSWTPDGTPHPLPGTLPPGEYIVTVELPDGSTIEMTIIVGDDGSVSIVGPDGELTPVEPGGTITIDGSATKYIVTWIIDGKKETEEYAYGEMPSHAKPKKASDVLCDYTFTGWTPAIVKVTADATYTAQFEASLSPFSPFSPFSPHSPFAPGSGTTDGSGTPDGSTTSGTGLPFTDVTPDSPYLEDIQYVYENDLMNGMSETEFGEYLPLTRGMIVTVLHRMEGRPAVAWTGVFTDVPAGMWYTDGVEWAASHGIVLGYGDGRYGPNDNVTREQLAAILHRYAKYKGYDVSVGEDTNILSYNDAFIWGDWAVPALQWACGTGVLEDVPAGMLRPTEPATRGEIAHAIHVFCEDVAK